MTYGGRRYSVLCAESAVLKDRIGRGQRRAARYYAPPDLLPEMTNIIPNHDSATGDRKNRKTRQDSPMAFTLMAATSERGPDHKDFHAHRHLCFLEWKFPEDRRVFPDVSHASCLESQGGILGECGRKMYAR